MEIGTQVVCTTNEISGYTQKSLVVGNYYTITNIIKLKDRELYQVMCNETGKYSLGINNFFMSKETFRDWKLKQILK